MLVGTIVWFCFVLSVLLLGNYAGYSQLVLPESDWHLKEACLLKSTPDVLQWCKGVHEDPTEHGIWTSLIEATRDCYIGYQISGNKTVPSFDASGLFWLVNTQPWMTSFMEDFQSDTGLRIRVDSHPIAEYIHSWLEVWPTDVDPGPNDFWFISAEVLGENIGRNVFTDLTGWLLNDESYHLMDIPAQFRDAGSSAYAGEYSVLPLWFTSYHLLYRRDVFALNNISVPRTWDDAVAIADKYGRGALGPGQPDLGFCFESNTACGYAQVIFIYIVGTIVQLRGPSHGSWFDPMTMAPLFTNPDVMHEALRLFIALKAHSVPDSTPCSEVFDMLSSGRCLMLWSFSFVFKRASHNSSAMRGRQGVLKTLGSSRVLDRNRPADGLVPCTRELCPYAYLESISDSPAGGSPASADVSTNITYNGSNGTSYMLVNRVVPIESGGFTINSKAPLYRQAAAFVALHEFTGPESHREMMLDPTTEVTPIRVSDLDDDLWVNAGYERDDVEEFLQIYRQDFLEGNVIYELRIPGVFQTYTLIINMLNQALAGNSTMDELRLYLETQTRQIISDVGGRDWLLQLYRLSIGYLPPEQIVEKRSFTKGSVTVLLAALVSTAAVLVVTAAALWGYLHWRRRRADRRAQTRGSPGVSPTASLLVTDIQDSTSLWESLAAEVMDVAVKLHHRIIREQVLKHGGYESATEGDSFILAFHSPDAALGFALAAQEVLLEAEWPRDLLASPYAVPLIVRRDAMVATAVAACLTAPPLLRDVMSLIPQQQQRQPPALPAATAAAAPTTVAATGSGLPEGDDADGSGWRLRPTKLQSPAQMPQGPQAPSRPLRQRGPLRATSLNGWLLIRKPRPLPRPLPQPQPLSQPQPLLQTDAILDCVHNLDDVITPHCTGDADVESVEQAPLSLHSLPLSRPLTPLCDSPGNGGGGDGGFHSHKRWMTEVTQMQSVRRNPTACAGMSSSPQLLDWTEESRREAQGRVSVTGFLEAAVETATEISCCRDLDNSSIETQGGGGAGVEGAANGSGGVVNGIEPPAVHAFRLVDVIARMFPKDVLHDSPELRADQIVLFRGLRVRMGLHCGINTAAEVQYNLASGRIVYPGPTLQMAKAVADAGHGGQITITARASFGVTHPKASSINAMDDLAIYSSDGGVALPYIILAAGNHVLKPSGPPVQLLGVYSRRLVARAAHVGPPRTEATKVPSALSAPLGRVAVALAQMQDAVDFASWGLEISMESHRAMWGEAGILACRHGGYLVSSPPGSFQAVFCHPESALRWLLELQEHLGPTQQQQKGTRPSSPGVTGGDSGPELGPYGHLYNPILMVNSNFNHSVDSREAATCLQRATASVRLSVFHVKGGVAAGDVMATLRVGGSLSYSGSAAKHAACLAAHATWNEILVSVEITRAVDGKDHPALDLLLMQQQQQRSRAKSRSGRNRIPIVLQPLPQPSIQPQPQPQPQSPLQRPASTSLLDSLPLPPAGPPVGTLALPQQASSASSSRMATFQAHSAGHILGIAQQPPQQQQVLTSPSVRLVEGPVSMYSPLDHAASAVLDSLMPSLTPTEDIHSQPLLPLQRPSLLQPPLLSSHQPVPLPAPPTVIGGQPGGKKIAAGAAAATTSANTIPLVWGSGLRQVKIKGGVILACTARLDLSVLAPP